MPDIPLLRMQSVALVTLAAAVFAPEPARAETYHHCTGFVDTLPAVLTTQGTWCLRKDLATSLNSGNIISIAANNITLDCNGYKIGNLAAPPQRNATGIHASGRSNLAIRGCSLRGFAYGIDLGGGFSHLIEHNTVDGARISGIYSRGDHAVIRHNRISDTGIDDDGGLGLTMGITVQGDGYVVNDNVIAGVYGTDDDEPAVGIFYSSFGGWIRANYVSGLVDGGGGIAGLKTNTASQAVVEGNVIVNPPGPGRGIDVANGGNTRSVCKGNTVRGFQTSAFNLCKDGGGNYSD